MTWSSTNQKPPSVLLQCGQEGWRRFASPLRTIEATSLDDVLPALRKIQALTERGHYAAGFLTYEAAPAFDGALVTHRPESLPLLWFGVFETCELVRHAPSPPTTPPVGEATQWQPSLDFASYSDSVAHIRRRIARGDTYQVNYTWRLDAEFEFDPWPLFLSLSHRHRTRYAAFVDTGEQTICSLSPELFFRLDGDRLLCRPMKGTARRGRYRAEDEERARELRESPKERAENVMIVDMMRNDLGRIARPGSVETTRLFEVETYPTVLQMTSTIEAETDSSPLEIMTALFPCASITGAPKVETMKIIADLEDRPRGIYTGSIGYLGPDRRALFNVAIRTLEIDPSAGRAQYGTGGGIVWDSQPEAEFLEGGTKALILAPPTPDYDLLETMRWESGRYHLLRRHLDRLADSADFLGFVWNEVALRERLEDLSNQLDRESAEDPGGTEGRKHRVRLLLSRTGEVQLEHRPLEHSERPWTVEVAREPINPEDKFFYHKTTARGAYDAFRNDAPAADDVLLWNPDRELTETTLANVAVQLQGQWFTPPIACGLLGGTERAELLARGHLAERVLTLDELEQSESLALLNSVRGWIPAQLVDRSR